MKKKYICRKENLYVICLFLFFISIKTSFLSAQCNPCVPGMVNNDNGDPWSSECYLNNSCAEQGNPCQANDVRLTGVFIADAMGNPVQACNIGDPVSALLWGNFTNNTGTDRYAIRTNTEVWINGVCNVELNSCSFDLLASGATAASLVGAFNYICGDQIQLMNTWIGWNTSASQCSDPGGSNYNDVCGEYSPSKCSKDLGAINFLAPNFDFTCGDVTSTTTEVCFTDLTIGGTPPYMWDWDFGDGGMSTLQNPCHTYSATSGTFVVVLTVTDSNGTSAGAMLTIDLDSLVCCNLSATCPSMNGGFFTCIEDVPLPDTNLVVVTDSCGSILTIVQADTTGTGCILDTMTITRRYIFTDGSNLDTCIQIFKVADDQPPFVECPAPITVQCAPQVPAPNVSLVSATDNCPGNTIATFVSDVTSDQTCANRFTVTRTYRVQDQCGNSATCTQSITVFDNTPPSLTCPANVTVQCASQVPAPAPGSVTSTDNCAGGATITHVGDVTTNQTCANRFTITRTYRATDACGNSATCNQIISVFDNTPPSITCPANVTVQCANQVPTPDPASITSSDNCGGTATVTHAGDVITGQTCANRLTITRTYRSTDACGNSATCNQIISVFDNTLPSITCPANVTVQCANQVPTPNPASITSTDNCGGTATVTHVGDAVSNQTCVNQFNITRTYRAIDECGNSATCTQTITVFDNTAPGLTCPPNVTVQCANLVPAPNPASVTTTDNCGGTATVTHVGDITSNQTCVNRFTVTRTYQATDECGNSATCTQTITVFDNTPPSITCPQNVTVQCASLVPAPNTALVTSSDNCGGISTVTFIGDVTSNQTCVNRFTVTRTYRASDECGNSSTCNQTITVFDNTAPGITCPANLTVQCANQVPQPNPSLVNSTDNCGGSTTTTFVSDFVSNQTCSNRFTLTRTYRAIDECGNSATCTQTIAVFDNTAPGIICPANVTVQCTNLVPVPNPAIVTSTDNCGGTSTVIFESDVISNQTCANRFTLTRTYRATDECGNTATCTQVITVFDNTAPGLTCPPNVTISCANQVPPVNTGSVTSTDNCGGSATVTHVGDVITNQTCANRFTLTRTYRASDACGNSSTCSQTITVNDLTPPVITCPANVTIDFGTSTLPVTTGNPTGTDNCGGTPGFTFNDIVTPGICLQEFTITRTWTATDACGLTATCIQVVTVDGECQVDLSLTKELNPGQGPVEGGDNVTFTITVFNEGEVSIGSVTITDYIPQGFMLNDPDWTPDTLGSTGLSASIVLSIANGALDPDGLNPGENVTVEITLQADDDIIPGAYENRAEISFVFNTEGMDVTDDDIDSDPDQDDTNDPIGEDDIDAAVICVLAVPVILGDALVCRDEIVTYTIQNYNPNNTYIWSLNGGGTIIQNTGETITIHWQNTTGGPFTISVTVIIFQGCQSTAFLTVFIHGDEVLACNDHIQISLGPDGEAVLLSGMILEGEIFGDEGYIVIIIDENGDTIPNATLTCEHVGQTFTVKILNECGIQSCWGTVSVEDKIPPQITCVCPVEGVEISSFTGTLDDNSPIFTRPNTMAQGGNCTVGISGVPYQAFPFYLDMAGGNQFDVVTFTAPSGDSFIALYQDSFNPSSPCTNLVAADDDAGPGFLSQIVATLEADRTYILVMTTFDNTGNDFGDFEISILSNANVFIVDPACQVTCLEVDQLTDGIIPDGLQPEVTDNCDSVTVEIIDTETNFDNCAGGFIHVTWKATDVGGNTAICVQAFNIVPLTLDSLVFPPNFIGECGGSVNPIVTGWPQINGIDITDAGGVCNIFAGYWDKELIECGGGRKIVRTWTVLDWCTVEIIEGTQIIKLTDDEGPVLSCPPDLTVGTQFWYCYANVSVPKPNASDECSDVVTFSLASTGGTIVSYGDNFIINDLPLGTHTVTWTVTDECGNSSTCSFTITVEDDVAPVANCDQHTIVALTNDGPSGITLVPAQVFDDGSYDNCGPVTFRARRMDSCIDIDWTTEGACIDDIPGGNPPVNSRDRGTVHRPCVPFACCDVGAGPIMVELEVTDASGNVNYCMIEATVQDKISPFIECPPDITISCDFWFNVEEGTFVDEEGNNNGNLDEDPLSRVFGNMYDAFRYNENVRKPIIINDPGNDHVQQPHHWGIDGWADDNCEVNLQVRVRVINDCSGGDLPPGAPEGAVKLIERRFSASDGNEGIPPGTCTQRIWVVDFDPFYITDKTCFNNNPNDGVIWPCDALLTTCPDSLTGTGEPTVFDDACSLVGVAFEDTRFDFVDGACFKILREWSVIDWCQYDPVTGYGLWSYTQVIKVHDKDGPEFISCPGSPVTLCLADDGVSLPDNNQAFLGEENPLSSSCGVHLNLCQPVHEACSEFVNYDVKLYLFNGTEFIYLSPLTSEPVDENHNALLCFDTRKSGNPEIRNNGIPYNDPHCGDYHRILWSAEDGCGNWSHCEYLLRLEDCKQPTPVCINGLSTVVMPLGGQVTIWAKDFNASSVDDCTPAEELLYSFSGDNYQPSYTFTCDNVPAFGVEISVNIWVADGGTDDNCNGVISYDERNKDFCTTTIVITDNANVCDTSGNILAGEILTDHGDAISQVKVTLSSQGQTFPPFFTSSDGRYLFNHLLSGHNYSIIPERDDNHRNGVSTLDLVKIQKHLLGKEFFTSPYQYIAADANNNSSVSAIDLVELRKLILGITTTLPNSKSWAFVDKHFIMENPVHPWPFKGLINIAQLNGNIYDNDFVGVKIGDVNNTVQANATQIHPRDGRRVMNIKASVPEKVEQGEYIDMKLILPERVSGFQWTLETEGLEYAGIESEDILIGEENIGLLENGIVTMSWNGDIMDPFDGNQNIVIILKWKATTHGKVNKMIRLTSLITPAESYTLSDEILDVKLVYPGGTGNSDFSLYQNQPNPWNDQTIIGFDLPEDNHAKLTIFDITGKIITVQEGDFNAGYNTFILTAKQIPSTGVMYYRLESGGYSASKKMVLIR